jgi:hypothetical protein
MEDVAPSGDREERAILDGLAAVLRACRSLHDERVALGLTLEEVTAEYGWALERVDEGDVSAPIDALVYYAAAVGLRLEIGLSSPAG